MGRKIYKCDVKECEKVFSTKFSLKRHILRHLPTKKHICAHCGKSFCLPQYLEEHEYTHTGAKPFVCGVNGCGEVFRQRGKLSIHKKNAHNKHQEEEMMLGAGAASQLQNINSSFFRKLEQLEEEEKNELGIPPAFNRRNFGSMGLIVNDNFGNSIVNASTNSATQSNALIRQQAVQMGGERGTPRAAIDSKFTNMMSQQQISSSNQNQGLQSQIVNNSNKMQQMASSGLEVNSSMIGNAGPNSTQANQIRLYNLRQDNQMGLIEESNDDLNYQGQAFLEMQQIENQQRQEDSNMQRVQDRITYSGQLSQIKIENQQHQQLLQQIQGQHQQMQQKIQQHQQQEMEVAVLNMQAQQQQQQQQLQQINNIIQQQQILNNGGGAEEQIYEYGQSASPVAVVQQQYINPQLGLEMISVGEPLHSEQQIALAQALDQEQQQYEMQAQLIQQHPQLLNPGMVEMQVLASYAGVQPSSAQQLQLQQNLDLQTAAMCINLASQPQGIQLEQYQVDQQAAQLASIGFQNGNNCQSQLTNQLQVMSQLQQQTASSQQAQIYYDHI